MTPALQSCIKIYNQIKKDPSKQEEIEDYSALLHNELEEDFKSAFPIIFENYQDLKARAENLISRGYTFEVKDGQFHVISPHPGRMTVFHKVLNPKQLLNFLYQDHLTKDQEEICLLFLSNAASIVSLNLAINLF